MDLNKKKFLLTGVTVSTVLLDAYVNSVFLQAVSCVCLFWLAYYAYRMGETIWISFLGFAGVAYGPVGFMMGIVPLLSYVDFNLLPVRAIACAGVLTFAFIVDLPDAFNDKW